ncbi:MAG TPA: toll/interleukin-1 receptor domain-containing protein [Anaerolineales bacterium]|nr:toll/interleukin-1 receptor domain-containing protein [Anaerolineales bacterium]
MKSEELTKQVFLSNARNEQRLADAVAAVLSERGIKVWNEQEIPPAEVWAKKVEKALEQSDSMIAFLTPHSYSSSVVRNELEHALFNDRFKHRLLPVLIGHASDDFVRLPWILGRMKSLQIRASDPTRRRAKQIAKAFEDLLRISQAEG